MRYADRDVGEGLVPSRGGFKLVAPALAAVVLAVLLLGCIAGRRLDPPSPPTSRPEAEEPRPPSETAPSPESKSSRPSVSRRPTRSEIESRPFPSALPLPVDGASRAGLANSFYAPRSGGRHHHAIDIMAPRHTPVRATTDGFVSRKAFLKLGGKTITIIGPGGYRHYYAHLERWADVGEDDRVSAGELIGFVGNSGNARGGPTHLHYAIYGKDGRAVDPYPLLKRGPGSFE